MSNQQNPPDDLSIASDDWNRTPPNIQALLLEYRTRYERVQNAHAELHPIFSHDFLNPLTKIAGFVYLLEADLNEAKLLDTGYRDFTQGIKRSLEQEQHLLDDMNLLLRLEEADFESNWQPVSIEMLVNKSLRDYLQTAMMLKPPISIQAAPGDTYVLGSAYYISLCIHELIKTSGETPPDARITIGITHDKSASRVTIRVQRQGFYLNEDQQKEIRSVLHADNIPFPSDWISMYFVDQVITAHGGEFNFENVDDNGTIYSFWLPVVEA